MAVNILMNAPATSNTGDDLFLANTCIKSMLKKVENAKADVNQLEVQLGLVGR